MRGRRVLTDQAGGGPRGLCVEGVVMLVCLSQQQKADKQLLKPS